MLIVIMLNVVAPKHGHKWLDQKLTGDSTSRLCRVFNFRLGRFAAKQRMYSRAKRPLLDLKNPSLSRTGGPPIFYEPSSNKKWMS